MKKVIKYTEAETYSIVTLTIENDYFSITGSQYPINKPPTEKNMVVCGAIGDRIKDGGICELFNKLHLSNLDGVPIHALANSEYHYKNNSKEIFINHLRCEPEFYDYLKANGTKTNINSLIAMKIEELRPIWKKEAEKAIHLLNELK